MIRNEISGLSLFINLSYPNAFACITKGALKYIIEALGGYGEQGNLRFLLMVTWRHMQLFQENQAAEHVFEELGSISSNNSNFLF